MIFRAPFSAFLTPSGSASVLLFESSSRDIRLDELEAQYYGAILESDWGDEHLSGHHGELWVGAGCRDVSLVLSNELVGLHASVLARQIRLRSQADAAQVCIWLVDEQSSAVRAINVSVHLPIYERRGEWTIVSHAGIEERVAKLRVQGLPSETGGVLLGYIDQPLRRIFIVDALPAPGDSDKSPTGFVRGTEGLGEAVNRARRRTAGIVDYVGEWHSHPEFHSPRPSGDDVQLLAHLGRVLALDGLPAVMSIVGADGEVSYPSLKMAPDL